MLEGKKVLCARVCVCEVIEMRTCHFCRAMMNRVGNWELAVYSE